MSQEHESSDIFAALRRQAEEELQALPRSVAGLTVDEQIAILEDMLTRRPHIFRLIHELNVHQVELEMQHQELQQTQATLHRERDRYTEFYNYAPVGYLITDQHGKLQEINTTGARLLGVNQRALHDQLLQQLIVPDDQDTYHIHLRNLVRGQVPQACELRIARQDGAQFFVRLQSTYAEDHRGVPQCRTVLFDITERVRAEQGLQQANVTLEERVQERTAELHRAMEGQRFLARLSDQMITSLDLASLVRRVASMLLEQFADLCVVLLQTDSGTPALHTVAHEDPDQEAAARTWLEHELTTHGAQHPLLLVFHGEQTVYLGKLPAPPAQGTAAAPTEPALTSMLVVPLMARGQIIGVLGLLASQPYQPEDLRLAEDLAHRLGLTIDNATLHTDAQQAREQAEAALQAHKQLLNIITHDLRTPLAVMRGYVYLIRKHTAALGLPDTAQLDHDTAKMEAAIQRIDQQIGELVDVGL